MVYQHPGQVLLKQYLEPQKISQNALARAIKVPPRRINEIIHEKRSITADTAVRLAMYFGNNAGYWMHLQAEFEIEKARYRIGQQLSSLQAAEPVTDQPAVTLEKPVKTRVSNTIKRRLMR